MPPPYAAFFAFAIPEGILPMRYDMTCYDVLCREGFLWEAELPCRLKTTL